MHRGCFVWTPTPPPSGRRTPRPCPARVCVCVPFLAGLGGPASRARFGAPQLFLWPVSVRPLFARPALGWGCPVCGCCCVFSFLFFSFLLCAPVVFGVPCFPASGALGLGGLSSPRAPPFSLFSFFIPSPFPVCFFFLPAFPLSFFFSASPAFFSFPFVRPRCLWRSVFSGPGCLGPWRLVVPPPPPPFFSLFFSPPPSVFVLFSYLLFLSFWFFSSFFAFPPPFSFFPRQCPAGCAVRGLFVCPVIWGVLVCVAAALCPGGGRFALALCRSVLPGCACAPCVVACRVARVR